jgi:hypothetical protein
MTAHLDDALTDDARRTVAKKLVELMKRGDVRAIEFVFDRIDGRVPHKIDIGRLVEEEARAAGLSDEDTERAIAFASSLAAGLSSSP